jgi:antitoxin ParD1/3/4
MSVKASVSISNQQDRYARSLVEQGRFSSMSAVVQQGLDLLQQKTEADQLETEALKALLQERQVGPFESSAQFSERIDSMIARKRSEHGLES